MIFLALAVACSVAIALLFKWSEVRGEARLPLLTANYAVCTLMGWALLETRGEELGASVGFWTLAVGVGALLILGFAMFGAAIKAAGVGLAAAVMRLAVGIPFLASWLVWNETPSVGQGIGLVLAGVAFVLITRQPADPNRPETKRERLRAASVLVFLFLISGSLDVLLKLFDEAYADSVGRPLFLLVGFGVACALGVVLCLGERARGGPSWSLSGLGIGAVVGVFNYGSLAFMLLALETLPGTVAFPVNNVAVIVTVTLAGALVWREHVRPAAWAGLGLAVLALLLLGT